MRMERLAIAVAVAGILASGATALALVPSGRALGPVTYPEQCLGINTPSGDTCPQGLTAPGCCDGTGRLVWCQQGQLYCYDCPSLNKPEDQTCGWSQTASFSGYDCGKIGEDPSGENPIGCAVFCYPACTGRLCGPDGCNGTCGTCGATQGCDDQGQCVEIIADVIEPDVTEPDLNAPDVPEPDVATEDVPVVADTPLPDSPPPLDPGIDPGTDPGTATDVAFSDCPARDSTATDNPSVDGTPPVEPEADVPDEGTWTPPKKSSGGCAAGSGTPTLPCAMLLIGVAGALAMRRRRRHD